MVGECGWGSEQLILTDLGVQSKIKSRKCEATDILVVVKLKLPSIKKLFPLFTVAIFCVAIWVIHLELKDHSLKEILDGFSAIPTMHLLFSALLVVPGLVALACYDVVACAYLRIKVGVIKPLLTGVMAYSITNTTGHALVVGGILRLRIYPNWGVTVPQVGEIVGFGVLTYYMGLTFTAALAFIFEGDDLARILGKIQHVGPVLSAPWFMILVPIVLITGIVLWFCLLILRKQPITFRKHTFRLPSPMIGIFQLCASCADLVIVASVLYLLLQDHHGVNWLAFVGIFAVIQQIALLSLVPGGVGVFSVIMLLVLQPDAAHKPQVFATLLAFRALYYLTPFLLGGIAFLGFVLTQNSKALKQRVENHREKAT